MGIYINPQGMTKEQWLEKNGILADEVFLNEITEKTFHKNFGSLLPICLVDNGPFTAANVGYKIQEIKWWFHKDDLRPKKFYIVCIEDLEKVLDKEQMVFIKKHFK
jgi:hypothetical protein